MKISGFLFLLFFLYWDAFSSPQQQVYSFKNVTINQGLSQNSVVDIVEDSTGFMWFATQDGLNRYDGRNFLIFPVSFDDITTPNNAQLGKLLAVDNQLWMIKKGGEITRFDLFTQRFIPLNLPGRENEPLPPASCMHVDKDNGLWIGTLRDGLYYFDPQKNLQRYTETSSKPWKLPSNRIRSVFEDHCNNIWVLTDEGAIIVFGETGKAHLPGVNINVMTEASDGTYWLGTLGEGIYFKKKDSEEFRSFRGYDGREIPSELVVETIHADSQNKVWVGTYGHGLFIIDTISRKITHLMPNRQDPNSISFQDILTIKEDSRGGIWIGTDGGGISYYNRLFHIFRTFTIHSVKDSISIEQIRAIEIDEDGVVWLGTSGQGLTSYDPSQNTFKTFHLTPYKPGVSNYDRIVSLQTDAEGDLWVGTQGNGLLIMDRETGNIKKWFTTEAASGQEKIPDNTIWSMLPEEDSKMWVATRNAGLLLMDKEEGLREHYLIPSTGSSDPKGINVQSLLRLDDKRLLLGFDHKDLQLFDIASGEFTPITNRAIKEILDRGTDVKSLYYQDGWLWVGTAGKGVLITNLNTGKTYVLDDREMAAKQYDLQYSAREQGESLDEQQ